MSFLWRYSVFTVGYCQCVGVSLPLCSALVLSMPILQPQARHLMTNCATSPELYKNNLVRCLTLTLPASSRRALHSGHRSFGSSLSDLYTLCFFVLIGKSFPAFACILGVFGIIFGVCLMLLSHLSFRVRSENEGKRQASVPCRTNRR